MQTEEGPVLFWGVLITSGIFCLQYLSYLLIFHFISPNAAGRFKLNYKVSAFLLLYFGVGVLTLHQFGVIAILSLFVLLNVYGFLMDKYESKVVICFYAMLTIFITTLLGYLVTVLSYSLAYEYRSKWTVPFLSAFSPPILYYILKKMVSYLFPAPAIRQLKLYQFKITIGASCILIVGILSLGLIIYQEVESKNPYPSRMKIVAVFICLLSLFLMAIDRLYRLLRERELDKNKMEQYQQLQAYILEIEKLYEDIRCFRHDYANILLMLDEGVRTGDMAMIKEIYQHSIKPTESLLRGDSYSLDNLTHLGVSELKSIIASKILVAQQNGIHVVLEIENKINKMYMDIIDLCRIVSCFLDNAIEAARETPDPRIGIVLMSDPHLQTVLIRNTYYPEPLMAIPMDELYRKGFSTKANNRGLGLYNIKKVLHTNKYVTLDTRKDQDYFMQTLIIKKELP